MKYTLDISGYDEAGRPGVDHFGGLFISIDEAANHGEEQAARGRLPFKPKKIWIRDQGGALVRETVITLFPVRW